MPLPPRLDENDRVIAAIRTRVREALDADTRDVFLYHSDTDTFAFEGVVRWAYEDAPEHRMFGVHNFTVRRDDGEVALFWGAYDLSMDEALDACQRKRRALGR